MSNKVWDMEKYLKCFQGSFFGVHIHAWEDDGKQMVEVKWNPNHMIETEIERDDIEYTENLELGIRTFIVGNISHIPTNSRILFVSKEKE